MNSCDVRENRGNLRIDVLGPTKRVLARTTSAVCDNTLLKQGEAAIP